MVTFTELEEKLWNAVNTASSTIKLSERQNVFLRLLLLKRLSDVFEENARLREYNIGNCEQNNLEFNPSFFFVPESGRWNYLQDLHENIGYILNIAAREIENINPPLKEIFTSINYEQELFNINHELRELIHQLSYLNLSNGNLAKPNLLGKACEGLIEKFAYYAGQSVCHTPNTLAELLVHLVNIERGMRICDPVCATGSILVACANYIEQMGENPNYFSFYGEEKNLNLLGTAKINLLLHGIFNFDIRNGNTISNPQLVENGKLMRFDRVIANPPFNIDNWYHEGFEDTYYRFPYGVPPKNNGNFGFIQHILATLEKTGKAAVLIPLSTLSSGGQNGKIRSRILQADLIEAVIGLASKLFYGTSLPCAILILNRNKVEKRQKRVILIDARNDYQKIRNQNFLSSGNIAHIVNCYQSFTTEEGYSKVVSLEDLAANEYVLNINRYVLPPQIQKSEIDIEAEIIKLHKLEASRIEAENDMNQYLRDLGIEI